MPFLKYSMELFVVIGRKIRSLKVVSREFSAVFMHNMLLPLTVQLSAILLVRVPKVCFSSLDFVFRRNCLLFLLLLSSCPLWSTWKTSYDRLVG